MSSSSTVADWAVRPIRWRTASGSATTSNPATRAVPLVGMLSVVIIRTVVVLPAPLGPSIEKTVPAGTEKLTPSTAVKSSNLLTRSTASMAGALMTPGRTGARPGRGRRRSRPRWTAGARAGWRRRRAPAPRRSARSATRGRGGTAAGGRRRARSVRRSRRSAGRPAPATPSPAPGGTMVTQSSSESSPAPPSRGCRRRSRRARRRRGSRWRRRRARVGSAERWSSLMDATLGVTADTGLLDFC